MNLLTIACLLYSANPHQTLHITIDPSTGTLHGGTIISDCEESSIDTEGLTILRSTDGYIEWKGTFQDDVESGERVGQIHNFSVDAHIGDDGVFLSDWAGWYPTPVDGEGNPILRTIELQIEPIEDWEFVGSGNPAEEGRWITPRPVDGMALVGNKHIVSTSNVATPQGIVTISVHLAPSHADKANYYLDAAEQYLQLYTPLLGEYPYSQCTIVENFFSSGFAYPGFTVLGPRVVDGS